MSAAILVCDDEPVHRGLIRATLAHRGYRIYEIEDARHLLGAAKSTRPELVILDLRLPGTDGLELLGDLRADGETADVRVLVLTGSVRQREDALAAGADAFVTKPFSPRALAGYVEALLSAQV